MMVSVGDSTDVYLFQVLQGGQEFRKIRTLNGELGHFPASRTPRALHQLMQQPRPIQVSLQPGAKMGASLR